MHCCSALLVPRALIAQHTTYKLNRVFYHFRQIISISNFYIFYLYCSVLQSQLFTVRTVLCTQSEVPSLPDVMARTHKVPLKFPALAPRLQRENRGQLRILLPERGAAALAPPRRPITDLAVVQAAQRALDATIERREARRQEPADVIVIDD